MKNAKRKLVSPYAEINWDKASTFFHAAKLSIPTKKISAAILLQYLAKIADRGIVSLAHASDPASTEYLLFGTGPLSWQVKHMLSRFETQNYVSVHEDAEGKVTVKFTKQGLTRALSYRLDTMKLEKQKRWDGKWRVIIFDIPEKDRRLRDIFRARILQIGLHKLQESVYVSPYACFDEVEFLRELYGVVFTVRYLVAEKIEEDSLLRRHFGLQ